MHRAYIKGRLMVRIVKIPKNLELSNIAEARRSLKHTDQRTFTAASLMNVLDSLHAQVGIVKTYFSVNGKP